VGIGWHGGSVAARGMLHRVYPPLDDTRLLWEADALLDGLGPLDEPTLRRVVGERGIDVATAVLYQFVRRRDAEVVAAVEGFAATSAAALPRMSGELVLVPAAGWVERPEYGGDGAVIGAIGEAFGLRPRLVRTRSLGDVTGNAEQVRAALAGCAPRSVVLVTLSKGAAEVKVALRTPGPHRDAVRAWVDVGGLPRGSPMVDWGNARWREWVVAHALIASRKAARGFFYEMFHRLPLLDGPVELPPHTPTVSVVAFPLRWHLVGTLEGRHASLAPLGPNDGFGLLWDAVHPGPVIPVWGGSHYLRVPLLSQRLYGILAWLAGRVP
jgi:hypothetical protein